MNDWLEPLLKLLCVVIAVVVLSVATDDWRGEGKDKP
jgi:hypothetical protein